MAGLLAGSRWSMPEFPAPGRMRRLIRLFLCGLPTLAERQVVRKNDSTTVINKRPAQMFTDALLGN